MQDIHKTRFLAANYSNLQGLKAVPLGLLLILVVYWANGLKGRATDLTLPILLSLGILVLILAISRYYQVHYGKIEKKPSQKKVEFWLGAAGGGLGLGAFIVDNLFHLPFSATGLVFAAATVAEYLRMQWYAPGRYLLPGSAVCFLIILVTSLLPLLGAGEWWKLLGLRAQLFGVLFVVGVVMVISGLIGHLFFVRHLPVQEAQP
jgi:hypothetical protein